MYKKKREKPVEVKQVFTVEQILSKEKIMDHETIHCIEVASDMSGVKLPEGYKNMTWSKFVDSVKFISKEQEDLFVMYYLK